MKPTRAADIKADSGDLEPAESKERDGGDGQNDVSSDFIVDDVCSTGVSEQAGSHPTRRSHRKSLRPVCVYCRRMRDDRGVWCPAGSTGSDLPSLEITHFICPKCMAALRQQLRESGLLPTDE